MSLSALPRILVADPLAEDGIERLRKEAEVEVRTKQPEPALRELIGDFDALVVRSETKVTAPILEAANRLKVVGRAGVGIDNIDVAAATRRGILVVNAPLGNIVAAAEHAIGLLMALARNIAQADASIHRGEWDRKKYIGVEIREKVLGLLGLGNVGAEVAKRAQGLEMEVIAFDPAITAERADQLNVKLVSLEEVFQQADFVSVHVPLIEATRNLVNRRLFEMAKPGLRLINTARGGIVNEQDLAEALRQGQVAGAAADVFQQEPLEGSPLLELPNFIATPHIAASTKEAQKSVAFDVAEEVLAVLEGEPPRFAINAPSISTEELAFQRPYITLSQCLASLYVQLYGGRISSLEVELAGGLADREGSLITTAAIQGLIQPFVEERITPVNARLVASNRGLAITERRTPRTAPGYDNVLTLRVDGHELVGTVLLGEPRAMQIGRFQIDLILSGRWLASQHEDRPGVVGKAGTILGQHQINIASMQLGRDASSRQALMFLRVDQPVNEEVLKDLQAVPGVTDLRYVELDN